MATDLQNLLRNARPRDCIAVARRLGGSEMVGEKERERNRQPRPRPLVVLSVPPFHEPRERRAQGDGHVGTAENGSGLKRTRRMNQHRREGKVDFGHLQLCRLQSRNLVSRLQLCSVLAPSRTLKRPRERGKCAIMPKLYQLENDDWREIHGYEK